MSIETFAPDRAERSGKPESPRFDLDEERWQALVPEARVALAIAEIETKEETFEGPSKLTEALAERTALDTDTVKTTNRALLQKGYLDRSGFLKPGEALKLSLSEEGYAFLDEEILKVQ